MNWYIMFVPESFEEQLSCDKSAERSCKMTELTKYRL